MQHGQRNLLSDNFLVYFGNINKPKIITLILIIIFMIIIQIIAYSLEETIEESKYTKLFAVILTCFLYLILYYIILFHYLRHCPFNYCHYSSPTTHNLNEYTHINLFAIGDIQNLYGQNNSSNYKARRTYTQYYIDSLNQLMDKISKLDWTNIDFNENDEFKNILQNKPIGLISPGDCCQFNSDGRLFDSDNLGHYEYSFNNNPGDNGLLNLPSYECLGNHDYDRLNSKQGSIRKWYYQFGTSPTILMQRRRNEKRGYLVNSDDYGNYSCNFGKLHAIFINVWPSKERLLSGDPKGSLEFLESDLNKYNTYDWILISHYIPNKKDFADETEETDHVTTLPEFSKIIKEFGNKCKGLFCGHKHLLSPSIKRDKNNILWCIMSGPAAHTTYEQDNIKIPFISYDQSTNKLTLFRIDVTNLELNDHNFNYKIYNVTP